MFADKHFALFFIRSSMFVGKHFELFLAKINVNVCR